MIVAKLPENENERLLELYKYELLDTVYEKEFDSIVQLASKLCRASMSVITLLDSSRAWFKARAGFDGTEADRSISFCSHAILGDGLMEVQDAHNDERFYDNPSVTGEPFVRYYAGMPLVTNEGYKLGTLCVFDRHPQELDAEQKFAMKVLGEQIIKLFELRLLNKEVKKVNDTQQKIMAIMAHDIRGPLGNIQTTFQLKNEGYISDEEMKEMDSIIPGQLQHTIELLDNIVEWSKVQLSGFARQTVEFNAAELCGECLGLQSLSAKVKGNTLVNGTSPSLTLNWLPDLLRFILRNLLGNANKFTENGTITAEVTIAGAAIQVTVTDTGTGIDPKVQKALSEKNWLTPTSGTHDEKGSGLGLKMIFENVAELNGNILFRSNDPKGTIVTINIPL